MRLTKWCNTLVKISSKNSGTSKTPEQGQAIVPLGGIFAEAVTETIKVSGENRERERNQGLHLGDSH